MHESSYYQMKSFVDKYLDKYKSTNLTIVDIGSGDFNGTYKALFNSPSWKYLGLDIGKDSNVDIVVDDAYNWNQIQTESIDVVISGQAFEHIEFFWLTIKEIHRILKKDGYCFLIAPSHGTEHKFPVDCYRFYKDGMIAIAKWAGLSILEVGTHNKDSIYYDKMWRDSYLACTK